MSADLFGQGIPTVLQRYRHLPYFSPSLAGANDYVDVNLGHNIQPLGNGSSVTTNMFSIYYSTRQQGHSRNNSIRGTGTQTMDEFYSNRRRNEKLKLGFGTAVYSNDVGAIKEFFNSNTFAVHVPIANHTYLTLGLATGFNNTRINLEELSLRDANDPVYIRYQNSGGSNTFLHIDAGLGITSNDYFFALGVNNIANARMSGDKLAFSNPLISNLTGGYRFFHSHTFEAIAVSYVTFQPDLPTLWNVGIRGRYNEVVMGGVNLTSDKSILIQLGFQANDVFNFGYTYSTTTASDVPVVATHEIGVGLRFLNHGNYSPIW
jgi:type IX secretion system PorP/SprF family membrane protein